MADTIVPSGLYYTKEHEWIKVKGGVGTVGITDHAQHELGDITYVETPGKGMSLHQLQEAGVIESVKAASDIYSPISGEITEVNEELADNPSIINEEPYDGGWIFRIKLDDPLELDDLMSPAEYRDLLGKEE